jgi:hypothetical protein
MSMNAMMQIDERIVGSVKNDPKMKTSVLWRQLAAAIDREVSNVAKFNGALAKFFPDMKRKELIQFFNATRDGKYVKFPDGSQARY